MGMEYFSYRRIFIRYYETCASFNVRVKYVRNDTKVANQNNVMQYVVFSI